MQLVTREMRQQDIPASVELCRSSGWNQLESDWSVFLALNPGGARVAESDGELVGTVATIRYENRFSWVAMMLVNPQHQRTGIGTKLLSEALDLLGRETCVRLDATPAGRELYRRHGFTDECSIVRLTRSEGRSRLAEAVPESGRVRRMCEQDLPQVLSYDREVFGADRGAVLKSLFERSPECAWVLPGPGTAGEEILAYCFGRPGFRFHQIGPVVARNEAAAPEMISQCLTCSNGRSIGIDVPEYSPTWVRWFEAHGFVAERSFIRMQRGNNRHLGDTASTFAIIGPEFG